MLLLCKGGVAHGSLWRETLGFKDAQRVEPPSSAYRRLPLRLSPHRRHEMLHCSTVPPVGCRPRGAVVQPADAVATTAVPSHLQVYC
ncbi:hypothetical protein NDU88_005910 [Pleurodeles waltl]|uniref:Uncharacterized protein n=1 Tax=Pleurodeles waltl TaxID=8319 RepID=A0AAV7NNT0_PLEWA|nr:hypothetical protein NDU88_005910 [Pleurodeles waltl]